MPELSSVPDPAPPTSQDAAAYIHDMARSLARMARAAGLTQTVAALEAAAAVSEAEQPSAGDSENAGGR